MAYFSNGSEGEHLEAQCADCPLDYHNNHAQPCPLQLVQSRYNYDQVKPGNEQLRAALNLLISPEGDCRLKPLLVNDPEADSPHALRR